MNSSNRAGFLKLAKVGAAASSFGLTYAKKASSQP